MSPEEGGAKKRTQGDDTRLIASIVLKGYFFKPMEHMLEMTAHQNVIKEANFRRHSLYFYANTTNTPKLNYLKGLLFLLHLLVAIQVPLTRVRETLVALLNSNELLELQGSKSNRERISRAYTHFARSP